MNAGTGGFVVMLLGALLWKLGLIGGTGGPIPTAGGSETRPSTAGLSADPATRNVDSRAAGAAEPRFRIVAFVVTRETEPKVQAGRRIGLYAPGSAQAATIAISGVDGRARLLCPPELETALLQGELALVFEDRPEAGARGIPAPRRVPTSRTAGLPFDIEIGLDDDLLTTPAVVVEASESRAASAPTSRDGAAPLASGPATITGRLVFRDGKPAERKAFKLAVFRPLGGGKTQDVLDLKTDAGGRFTATVEPGRDILAELYAAAGTGDAAAPFVLKTDVLDAAHPLSYGDVRLAREALIVSGRVVDATGAGVADAAVAVRPAGADADALGARTDAEGRFTVRGPEDFDRFEVFAETEESAGRSGAELRRGAADVAVVLGTAGQVVGQVETKAACVLPVVELALWTKAGARVASARPRRDGSFRFVHVAAGIYDVTATAPASGSTTSTVEVEAGRTAAIPRPVVAGADYVLRRVTVRDDAGKAIPGAIVEASLAGRKSTVIAAETGADGSADLYLPPGVAAPLTVSCKGFTPRDIEPVGGSDTQIVLRRLW